VGHLAVQIAKARGAHVVAVAGAGAGKHTLLHELGGDDVLDRARPYWTGIAPVQAVLDLGGETTARSLDLLEPGGTLVRLPVWRAEDAPVRARAADAGQRAVRLLVEPDLGGLTALVDLVERGQLRVHIDAVYDLALAAQAHTHVEAGHTTGKVVLRVLQDEPSEAGR
jgi:NADPH:quinone reductase-like Zn-dependent oxidoreductase